MTYTASQYFGARNLLMNCAQARPGETVLIAHEPADLGYYDNRVVDCVASAAEGLGMVAKSLNVGFDSQARALPDEVVQAFDSADVIVFFARLGDQLRFSQMPEGKRIVVSYALCPDMLGSGFGTAHHDAFLRLKDAVNSAIASAENVHVTCPRGTDYIGQPQLKLTTGSDTTIRRFPMSVPTPIPAHSFSGRVAMPGFLTGTGSQYYTPYTVEFQGEVFALFEQGRLTGFEGDAESVAVANRHYDHVADSLGIDRDFVHSWHAGIHPGCGFPGMARDSYERWGGAGFGNPRVLHFHTCGGYAPGEISWNVIDPTVTLDGVKLWDNGRLRVDNLQESSEIMDMFPCAAQTFARPDDRIGF